MSSGGLETGWNPLPPSSGDTSDSRLMSSDDLRLSGTPRPWATLETAKRCLLVMSFVFLVVGVVLTTVGFAARPHKERSKPSGFLALQVGGPVCLFLAAVGCLRWWSRVSMGPFHRPRPNPTHGSTQPMDNSVVVLYVWLRRPLC